MFENHLGSDFNDANDIGDPTVAVCIGSGFWLTTAQSPKSNVQSLQDPLGSKANPGGENPTTLRSDLEPVFLVAEGLNADGSLIENYKRGLRQHIFPTDNRNFALSSPSAFWLNPPRATNKRDLAFARLRRANAKCLELRRRPPLLIRQTFDPSCGATGCR